MKMNRYRSAFVATGVAILWSAVSLAQLPAPLRPVPGRVVQTVTAPGFFSEPSVAVNPRNPQQVVVAYQVPASILYSQDGGKHWSHAAGVAPDNFKTSGDVSVTFDNQGHAILCYIAFNKLGTYNYWGHAANTNGIFVRRSLDGGKTWDEPAVAVSVQQQEPGIPMEDKPYVVADTSHGPHAGNLYIAWTRWSLADSRMVLSRSTDDGKTWTRPMEIDQSPGLPRDDNGALEGFDGAVGADSTLYAVWSKGNHIQFTTSRDGGKSFSRVANILHTAPIMFAVQDFERANGFPQIGVDPRSGDFRHARLYVTWSDYRYGDIDVFCSRSTDGGQTWGAPVRVNDDPIHDGSDQFFQWSALDPVSGAFSVIFYDRRRDPDDHKTVVTLARSTDGGKSFANYAWSHTPFVAAGDFMGDYSGIASYNGRVYGAWTEETAAKGPPVKAADPAAKRSNAHTVIRVGVADFSEPDSGHNEGMPGGGMKQGSGL